MNSGNFNSSASKSSNVSAFLFLFLPAVFSVAPHPQNPGYHLPFVRSIEKINGMGSASASLCHRFPLFPLSSIFPPSQLRNGSVRLRQSLHPGNATSHPLWILDPQSLLFSVSLSPPSVEHAHTHQLPSSHHFLCFGTFHF